MNCFGNAFDATLQTGSQGPETAASGYFDQQVQPGSFEYALCYLVDHELDLSAFHARYKNDDEGAPAFNPAVLIKIVLLAYSRGIVSSRRIEAACRENVLFIAVSGDSQPHFTTLAAFIAEMGDLAAKQDCLPCPMRSQCLRHPQKTKTRQVAFFLGKAPGHESHTDRMKAKIDSEQGKQMITRRFATVEPVFGNLRGNKGLDRFTLRGRNKVDGQWKLYCLVHNIEKLTHHGYAH
jgi:hypothetical protein